MGGDILSFNWIPTAWGYAEPLVALLTFGFVFYTWYRIRRSYKEVIEGGTSGKPVVLSFHNDFRKEATQDGWAEGYRIVHYPLQDVDLNTPQGLEDDLMRRLEAFKQQYPDLFGRLQANDGNVVITITGSSSVLSIWLPLLHGISGQFPKITYPIRRPTGGHVWSKPIDGQRIRLTASERFRAIVEFVSPRTQRGNAPESQ